MNPPSALPPAQRSGRAFGWQTDLRGGLEAAVQTFPNSIGPLLLFAAVLGPAGVLPGFWAAVITASAARLAALVLRGSRAVISCSRMASLAVFTALVLQLSRTAAGSSAVDTAALQLGLLAAGLLFLFASALVLTAGLLRWGLVFKMIPTPVLSGIGTGTALLLLWQACLQFSTGWQHAAVALVMFVVFLAWPSWKSRPPVLQALGPAVVAPLLGLLLMSALLPLPPAQPAAGLVAHVQGIPLAQLDRILEPELPRLLLIGLPGALTLALVMVLETFYAVGVMESRYGAKVDANRELVALGGANLLSAALGGVPSTGTGVGSSANWEAGGRGTAAVVTCLALATLALLLLSPWAAALPAGLTAGFLLIHAAMTADRRWLNQALGKLRHPRQGKLDQAFWLSAIIAGVAFTGGLTWAAFLGICLSTLIVLRRLAHRSTARWEGLRHHRSRRIRSAAEEHLLDEARDVVAVLKLNGHLFFGNSVRLRQLADEAHPQAKSAVIDVSNVQDVDTSGCEAVQGLVSELRRQGMTVVLCGLQSCRAHELQRGLEALPPRPGLAQEPDLDRALERCENMVLQSGGAPPSPESTPLERNRLLQGLSPEQASAVLAHGRVREVDQAQALFQREEPADDVWLIERGSVSVLTQHQPGSPRLATFGPGHFIGEMAFLDGRPRSATALADTPVRALQLDAQAFAHLRSTHPEAALELALNIARELSSRVRAANLQLHAGEED
jgi:SulP family sulfate permease